MTIPKLTPFEAIVFGGCSFTRHPLPRSTRWRRQLGLGHFGIEVPRSEPRLPVAILWGTNPRTPPVAQEVLHGGLANLDIDGFYTCVLRV